MQSAINASEHPTTESELFFGRTKSPIKPTTQAWLEYGLQWLVEQLGPRHLLDSPTVLPDAPELQIRFPIEKSQLETFIEFLTTQLGLRSANFPVVASDSTFSIWHLPEGANQPDSVFDPHQSQTSVLDMAKWMVQTKLPSDPVDSPFPNREVLAEFMCATHGLGIIVANESVIEKRIHSQPNAMSGFVLEYAKLPVRTAAISAFETGAILGLIQNAKRDEDVSWSRALRPDSLNAMKKMLPHLEKVNSFFDADSLFQNKTAADRMRCLDLLQSSRNVDKIIALNWLLPKLSNNDIDVMLIINLARDKDAAVRSAAAWALAIYAQADPGNTPLDVFDQLSILVEDRDDDVRIHAAYGLAPLPLNEPTIKHLCSLLSDSNRELINAAAFALSQSSEFVETIIPAICQALSISMARGENETIESLISTLDEISPQPETHLREALDHNEHDFLFAATDVLRDIRLAKKQLAAEPPHSSAD